MQYFGSLRGWKAVKWFSSTFKDFQINSSTFKALILWNEIQALLRLFKARANPVHWFYRELNSLHIGRKIKHIFNMKVDHICVGTREIQSTTSRWSWRRWHWQCRPDTWKPQSTSNESKQGANDYKNAYKVPQLVFLTRQNLSNSYPNTATCAWLRMPYTAYGMLTQFSEYIDKTIRKSPKLKIIL